MIFESIELINWQGIVECRSSFYSAVDSFNYDSLLFKQGINCLNGSIDSGIWAMSYLLSMYSNDKHAIFFREPGIYINNIPATLQEIMCHSVYLDEISPLFSNKKSIYQLAVSLAKKNHLSLDVNEIFEAFCISSLKKNRPLNQMGNDFFQAMAAIALCANKNIFCLPWMSSKRIKYFKNHLEITIKALSDLEQIVIFPCEVSTFLEV